VPKLHQITENHPIAFLVLDLKTTRKPASILQFAYIRGIFRDALENGGNRFPLRTNPL
jgi:hypothetical protein